MSAEASLPPLIAAQLNYLLAHSTLSVKVDQIWSGCKNARYSDHFTLLIPFCLDYLKWDVIYNALYPSAAPDIVFSPEDEDFHPLLDIAVGEGEGEGEREGRVKKSSLYDWNCKDPSRLLALVHEIRDLYMDYQRKRVGELDDERLTFEASTILSREGIEVCTISGPDRPEEVKFAVPLLDMDLNKLVHGCPWRQQQKIYLQAVFPVSRKYTSASSAPAPSAPRIKLVSTSDLKTLFSIEDVKLPPWVDGMCMAEYLPTLEENLKLQVIEAVASIGARRRFIEALAPIFGRPIEADPVFCRKATVLAVSGTFTFLVHFSLPTQFPKQQPVLTMQSGQKKGASIVLISNINAIRGRKINILYDQVHPDHTVAHISSRTCNIDLEFEGTGRFGIIKSYAQSHCNTQGAAILSPPITDYPWSPRWDASQMAERIFEFLVDECLSFKKYCADLMPQ